MSKPTPNDRGFTVNELMGVVLMIGLLAFFGIRLADNEVDEKRAAAEVALDEREQALHAQASALGYTVMTDERAGVRYDYSVSFTHPIDPGYKRYVLRSDKDGTVLFARQAESGVRVVDDKSGVPLSTYVAERTGS